MLPSNTQNSFSKNLYEVQSYRNDFYSKYSDRKTIDAHIHWRRKLRRIGLYFRLVTLGALMIVVGGVFPLVISYELFFKSILTNACTSCMTPDIKNFVFNYGIASMMAVMGLLMPILVLVIFFHMIRNSSFRNEIMN